MAKLVLKPVRTMAYRTLVLQAAVVLVIAFLLFVFQDSKACWSALMGGLAWMIPNFYFANRFFSTMSPRAVTTIMRNFFMGEIIKLVVSGILFVLIIKFLPVSPPALLLGYIGALLAIFCAAPFLLFGKQRVNTP